MRSRAPSGWTTFPRWSRPGTAEPKPGPALADVLTGAAEPAGRLPFSVPDDVADLPPFDPEADTFTYDRWHGWWHLARNGTEPTFPFGFGLAYTTFELTDLEVTITDGTIVAAGTVRNTGERPGSDVIQLTTSATDHDTPARLIGFTRVDVPAGGATPFHIAAPIDRLATRDPVAHAWRPVGGTHTFALGRYANDPRRLLFKIQI